LEGGNWGNGRRGGGGRVEIFARLMVEDSTLRLLLERSSTSSGRTFILFFISVD
jgi:hypothetical protein